MTAAPPRALDQVLRQRGGKPEGEEIRFLCRQFTSGSPRGGPK